MDIPRKLTTAVNEGQPTFSKNEIPRNPHVLVFNTVDRNEKGIKMTTGKLKDLSSSLKNTIRLDKIN